MRDPARLVIEKVLQIIAGGLLRIESRFVVCFITVRVFMALIFNLFDMFVIHAGAGGAGSPRGFIVRSEGTNIVANLGLADPLRIGNKAIFAPPEHERLAVSAISDRLPFDIVDIIKIIFHRVVGFEGLRTYLRISGQTSTLPTPQRGRAPEYPTMVPPLPFAPAPTWRTAQG